MWSGLQNPKQTRFCWGSYRLRIGTDSSLGCSHDCGDLEVGSSLPDCRRRRCPRSASADGRTRSRADGPENRSGCQLEASRKRVRIRQNFGFGSRDQNRRLTLGLRDDLPSITAAAVRHRRTAPHGRPPGSDPTWWRTGGSDLVPEQPVWF